MGDRDADDFPREVFSDAVGPLNGNDAPLVAKSVGEPRRFKVARGAHPISIDVIEIFEAASVTGDFIPSYHKKSWACDVFSDAQPARKPFNERGFSGTEVALERNDERPLLVWGYALGEQFCQRECFVFRSNFDDHKSFFSFSSPRCS